ncbi:Fe-S cluster assembly sulfur transfer protein SufU [Butyrivibrio sp. XPD2006]|uniref:Fe-S cluster assembly sulfur transfer protein SufU n=1 Tax=Butyrivibrio sp. XPD2006 TaxID=1280668 RepID=UPI0003B76F33|nr:SUF system NifU family Fe-S cluster assembly protein [Butyrivibrio sp. XPD2006]
MELKQLYREIVNEHNLHPMHKRAIENPDLVLRGVNPSCGDDITLSLKIKDGVIEDGGYEGSGCAISQASVDMMVDQIIGKKTEEAVKLAETFMGMIKGEVTDEESIESLDEAAALQDVAHMPARVKCAVLGWRTMKEMIENPEKAQG